jgi:hypothetical protein
MHQTGAGISHRSAALRARPIRQAEARRVLAELYLRSVGAARPKDLTLLFGWSKGEVDTTIAALAQDNTVRCGIGLADLPGDWIALTELV